MFAPWLAACGLADLVPSPPPPEVTQALRLPPGALVDQAECAGTPRTQDFTCVVQATASVAMAPGAEEAGRWFVDAGWEEVAWDRVPGRIQWSFRRDLEHVSLAVHDRGGTSRWSYGYAWGEYPDPFVPAPLHGPPDPNATWPEALADAPRPDDAVILTGADPGYDVVFSTAAPVDDVIDRFHAWPGASELLLSRAPRTRAARVRVERREVQLTAFRTDDDGWIYAMRATPALGW